MRRLIDRTVEQSFGRFQAVVVAIRNARAELNVPVESRPAVQLVTTQPSVRKFFESHQALLQAAAHVGEVTVAAKGRRAPQAAAMMVDGVEIVVPLAGLIDPARERERLQQRVGELAKQLTQVETRLRDKQFLGNAPQEVVAQTKERRLQLRLTLKRLSGHLAVVQSL